MANVIKHKRGSGSDPSASDLILGELAIRTDTGKLFTKMDSGAIAEIAGGGSDIAINTLSSSSATGGGSATFNGSAYRFTLSAPPSVSAAQLLVSINGVIQKPVAGTGQPSKGFSVDGTDIILGDAPATGSDFFILTFKSLGVSEPADNSVTSAKIANGAIVNADINASAAIARTKLANVDLVDDTSPQLGGNLDTNSNLIIFADSNGTTNRLLFGTNKFQMLYDSGNSRMTIDNITGDFLIRNQASGGDIDIIASDDIRIRPAGGESGINLVKDGAVELYHNNSKKFETTNAGVDVTGSLSVANHITLPDQASGVGKIKMGDNVDFQIYHNGTHSVLENRTGSLLFYNNTNELAARFVPNGAVDLYYDNSKKFETTSSGATVTGSLNMGNELNMTEGVAATRSIDAFVGDAGTFRIRGTTSGDSSGHQVLAEFRRNAGVHLNHSALTKLETTSEGISISGSVSGNSISDATLRFNIVNSNGDEKKAQIISTKVADISSTIEFGTTVSHSYAERMRIHSNGFVGIGTAAPVRRLHLHNDSSTSNYLQVTNSTTGTSTTDGVLFGLSSQEDGLMWNYESNNLKFATANTERMRIDSDGDVLVGLTTALSTQAGSIQAAGPIIAKSYINNHTSNATVVEYINNISKIRAYGATSGSGVLVFNTGGGGDSADTERMRIESGGNVGINESSNINGRLHVQHDALAENILFATRYNSQLTDKPIFAVTEAQMTNFPDSGTVIGNHNRDMFIGPVFQDTGVVDTSAITKGICLRSAGDIGIGITNPDKTLHVVNTANHAHSPCFIKANGANNVRVLGLQSVRAATSSGIGGEFIAFFNAASTKIGSVSGENSTSYNTTSDYRLKENVVPISDGITRLKTLKPSRFNWKTNPSTTVDGFLAHEVTAVPEAITGTKDQVATSDDVNDEIKEGDPIYQEIDQSKLVPLLVAALQEAIGRIEVLEAK